MLPAIAPHQLEQYFQKTYSLPSIVSNSFPFATQSNGYPIASNQPLSLIIGGLIGKATLLPRFLYFFLHTMKPMIPASIFINVQ